MGKFIIEPHFRLQEWMAEEKGYFALHDCRHWLLLSRRRRYWYYRPEENVGRARRLRLWEPAARALYVVMQNVVMQTALPFIPARRYA